MLISILFLIFFLELFSKGFFTIYNIYIHTEDIFFILYTMYIVEIFIKFFVFFFVLMVLYKLILSVFMFSKGSASPVTPQERKLLFTGSLNIPNGNNNNRKRESEPDKESEDKTNKEQKKPNPQQRPEETTAQKLFK